MLWRWMSSARHTRHVSGPLDREEAHAEGEDARVRGLVSTELRIAVGSWPVAWQTQSQVEAASEHARLPELTT
jgi:hypothetical protein